MLKTLTIIAGDSYFISIPLLKGGLPWPIDGWKFWFTLKRSASDLDADAIVQKSTDAGTILAYRTTVAYVVGSPEDTKVEAAGRCEFDIQGESPEGDIVTLERGFVIIRPEVTRAA